ncbi:hypothetical protein CPB83DRAFT_852461 [Crepidotus variabilis]|uniref:Uncharacterized protein n=1 Tax=Crepidotus variabilis TaxID=179855 RepID=A0A9P6EIL7_9AGAR|nr:hypothetical protein CPB83DRAFT_852461 [Crepidotus variabilis]
MKFAISTFITTLVVLVQVSAEPIATSKSYQPTPVVYHCGGPNALVCPTGYRCCGPFLQGVGGTCFQGTTGLCPL